ncbi:FAD-dependent oxidoreductase [Roseateles sp. BYS180W]|uniref:FAD-dependent oxidoreductase n=1 Tax=Roseateles rivi TaxID=3299028 RepID=A0ABW7FWW8_9BURK
MSPPTSRQVSPVMLQLHLNGKPRQSPLCAQLGAMLAQLPPAQMRSSVRGQPRAPLCGMGVCQECRVQVNGQQALACQTLCAPDQSINTRTALLDSNAEPQALAEAQDCELLIIGTGPAGLHAALAAAPSGMRITLLDDNPAAGGQIWRQGREVAPPLARLLDELGRHANVRWLQGLRVVGRAGAQALLVEGAEQGYVLHYQRLVLCTGARELLLPFPGWTLPGVTGAGALQALIKGGLPVRGQRIVLAGSGPLLLAAAATARAAGARVQLIAEQAPWAALREFGAGLWRHPAKAWQALRLLQSGYQADTLVREAHGTLQLEAVTVERQGRLEFMPCERLACGFGLVPNVELGQLLGCTLAEHGGLHTDAQLQTSVPHIWAAGECTGHSGAELAAAQGQLAGLSAAGVSQPQDQAARLQRRLQQGLAWSQRVREHFALSDAVRQLARSNTLLCRCEDVPLSAVLPFDDWISAKLQTRCGMGACQGRICGAAARTLLGWQVPAPRQLLGPVRLSTLASVPPQE